MPRTLVKVGIALIAGAAGLAMVLASIERYDLLNARSERLGTEASIPMGICVLIVVGVLFLNLAVFVALVAWSQYLRRHPEMRQAPVWLLVAIIVVVGGLGITGAAAHSAHNRSLEAIPVSVGLGVHHGADGCGDGRRDSPHCLGGAVDSAAPAGTSPA